MADAAAPTRPDIDGFVSYSRRDAAKVIPLVSEAERQGRALWVDADDIPAGAPWRDELGNGLEKADTFVTCLSDDWLASAECRKEYDQAITLGKRLVPVVVGDLDEQAVPPALTVLQWVRARDVDPDEAVLQILAAIDIDHERVREHTYWLGRALRWDRQGQHRSLLARGQELRSAEDWLGRPGANPAPTPLQSRYVTASRRAERTRLRTLLVLAVAAVVVTGLLAVVALLQRSEAVAQREEADAQRAEAVRQRDTARSRQLATVALGQIDIDPERAVLLAREAWTISPTDEALASLRSAVNASYARFTTPTHTEPVTGVTWTSGVPGVVSVGLDGLLALTGDDGSQLSETELPQPKLQELVSAPTGNAGLVRSRAGAVEHWTLAEDGSVDHETVLDRDGVAVASATDGDALVAVRADGSGLLVRPAGPRPVTLAPHGEVSAAAVAGHGEVVTAGTDTGEVYVARDGGPPVEVTSFDTQVADLSLSDGGRRLLAADLAGSMVVLDTETGQEVWRPTGTAFVAALTPDGRSVVTGDVDGVVRLSDEDGTTRQLSPGGFVVNALAFSPDGSQVAGSSVNGPTRVWRLADGSQLASLSSASGSGSVVAFAADGERIVTGHGNGDVRIWQLPAVPVTIEPVSPELRIGSTDDVAISPDGTLLAAARTFVDFFGLPSRDEVDPTSCPAPPVGPDCLAGAIFSELPAQASAVAFDHAGALVAVGTATGELGVWDLASGRLLARAPSVGDRVQDVEFGPDGDWVAEVATNGVSVVSVDDGDLLAREHPGGNGNTVRVLPDGTIVHADDKGVVWASYVDGRPTTQLADLGGAPFASALSPDGDRLAYGMEGEVKLIDAEGADVASLPTGSGYVSAVAYTGDGAFLMAAGDDGKVQVWEAGTGELAFRLAGPGGQLQALAAGPSGGTVVVGGLAGTFELTCEVCVDEDELLGLAEERVTRELTPDEEERFLAP